MLCNRRANPMHIANHTQKSLSPTELLSAACRAIDCAASRRTPFAARFEGDGSKETANLTLVASIASSSLSGQVGCSRGPTALRLTISPKSWNGRVPTDVSDLASRLTTSLVSDLAWASPSNDSRYDVHEASRLLVPYRLANQPHRALKTPLEICHKRMRIAIVGTAEERLK